MRDQVVVYDTNRFVDCERSGNAQILPSSFVFTDINLFEWLKGKPKEKRKREFEFIDDLIRRTNSEYCFRTPFKSQEKAVSSNAPLSYRYAIADKVAKVVFKDLLEIYMVACNVVILAVAMKECGIKLGDENFQNGTAACSDFLRIDKSLVDVWTRCRKKMKSQLARALYEEPKNSVDSFGKDYFNLLGQCINKHSGFVALRNITEKVLNHNNVFVNNRVAFSEKELESLIGEFIQGTQNEQGTKRFIMSLVSSLVLKQDRFEFNDIADFYLDYIARSLGVEFDSGEKRWKRLAGIA